MLISIPIEHGKGKIQGHTCTVISSSGSNTLIATAFFGIQW